MPPPSRHGAETQAATPTTAAAISRNAGHWRRVSISIDSFQATISCAISSVISSSFTPSDLRMRFASKLDLFLRHGRCLRLCDSTQPCSRLPRRPYGRSIPISCTRRQEPKKRKRGRPRRNDPERLTLLADQPSDREDRQHSAIQMDVTRAHDNVVWHNLTRSKEEGLHDSVPCKMTQPSVTGTGLCRIYNPPKRGPSTAFAMNPFLGHR